MKNTRSIRQIIDLQIVPAMYYENQEAFSMTFAMHPQALFARAYTTAYEPIKPRHFWQKPRQFTEQDFQAYNKLCPDGMLVFYVSLPPADDGSLVFCTAFAVAIRENQYHFFTIDQNATGKKHIGTVDESGQHIVFEYATDSVEKNMELVHKHASIRQKNASVQIQKITNADGSYRETVRDNKNKLVIVQEYNTNGMLLRTTYDVFADDEEENEKTAEEWLAEGKTYFANKEYESALECYIHAADLNNADAQNRAGMMLYNGRGIEQNNEQAFLLIKKSAENGNVSAMGNLGTMYDKGRGTVIDYKLAYHWYKKALDNGIDNYSVLNNIGFLYMHGRGVAADYDKAQIYFEKALGKGCEAAERNLIRLKELRAEQEQKTVSETDNEPETKYSREIMWKPKNILDELQRVTMSCSSAPIVGTPEENARYVMDKISYFRENGVEESELYMLECKILQFMPDYVAENFSEFYAFLKEDISSIIMTMELFMARGDYAAAKKIAEPMADYLERNKEALINGHHCHQNAFETAMYTLKEKRQIATQHTKSNYTAFLILYARVLQHTRILRNNRDEFCMKESRKYLEWAKELNPQNAGAWLYLGVSYTGDEALKLEIFKTVQLDLYKEALKYCYLKDGDYGLTKIYEHMAMYYWGKNQIEVVAALRDYITELGGNSIVLTFLLSKRHVTLSRPYWDILRKNGIQIGFSELVKKTADFLSDPRADMQNNPQIQELIVDVRSV